MEKRMEKLYEIMNFSIWLIVVLNLDDVLEGPPTVEQKKNDSDDVELSRLEAVGEELKDRDKALQLVWTLPDSYKTLTWNFMSRSSFTTSKVCQALSAEEMMRKRDRISTVQEGAFVAKGTNKGRKTIFKEDCFKCGQPGHCARDCPRKKDGIREKLAINPDGAATVAMTSYDKEADLTDVLLMPVNRSQGGWFLDCGAAVHVCNNRSLYSTYEDCSGFVYMGDGSRLLVRGVGEIRLDLFDGSVQTIINVRHVPKVKWNLISLSRLESLGMWYSTRGGVMSMYHSDDVVLKASLCRGLYRLHGRVVYDGDREPRSICSGGANAARMSYGLGGGSRPLTTQRYVPVRMSNMDMV